MMALIHILRTVSTLSAARADRRRRVLWCSWSSGSFSIASSFSIPICLRLRFWTGIAVGSLALLMLQHLTGGGWGFVIRRVLEAATRTLPLMADSVCADHARRALDLSPGPITKTSRNIRCCAVKAEVSESAVFHDSRG